MNRSLLTALVASLTPVNDLQAAPGDVDTTFDTGREGSGFTPGIVQTIAALPDGKVLIGGGIYELGDTEIHGLTRLNPDGSVDSTFNPGTGANGTVASLVRLADGKVLVGGSFTTMNETSRRGVARLNPDGGLDDTFDPGSGARRGFNVGRVWSIAVQPDGKVLAGGAFSTFDDTARNLIARLLPEGSLDSTFDPGEWAEGTILSVAVQSDGKVLAGGDLTLADDASKIGIARLNTNGSWDSTFHPGAGGGAEVQSIVVQPDGKIVLGGFNAGRTEGVLARLNADGSLDSTFNPGTVTSQLVHSVALQTDGKVLVGGYEAGTRRGFVDRLNADGSLDSTFNRGAGADDLVWSVVVQPDGNLLVGGDFGSLNGTFQVYVVRVFGSPAVTLPSLSIERVSDHVLVRWTNPAFILQSAPLVNGPYSTVSGATSPYTSEITGPQRYFVLSGN